MSYNNDTGPRGGCTFAALGILALFATAIVLAVT